MNERYVRNPDVEMAPMRDECVLFNPSNSKFCLLNRTAAMLWQRLESPRTAEELAAELEGHFAGVSREKAVEDVRNAVRELIVAECVKTD